MIAPIDIDKLIESSTGSQQLAYIKQLRNAIVGHDEEKLEHANTNAIPVLLKIIEDSNVPIQNRIDASITIASFSFGMSVLPALLVYIICYT